MVLNNNSEISKNAIELFNCDLLLKDFKKLLNLQKVGFKKYIILKQ